MWLPRLISPFSTRPALLTFLAKVKTSPQTFVILSHNTSDMTQAGALTMKIKTNKRWIKSILETAQQDTPALPWQRGSRRNSFVAKRQYQSLKAKPA